MKKVCIFLAVLLFVLITAGCATFTQPPAAVVDDTEQELRITVSNEYANHEEDDIASDTLIGAEQHVEDETFEQVETIDRYQYFFDNYIALLPDWILTRSWDMESMIYQLPTPNGPYPDRPIFPATMLMVAFQTIVGLDETDHIIEQYGIFNVPASIIENVLLRYFPFTTNQLRDIMARERFYDESTNTYHLSTEVRFDTIEETGVITKIEESAGYVRLFYNIYARDMATWQLTSDIAVSGILTLQQSEDGFVVLSVTITYGFVNWGG